MDDETPISGHESVRIISAEEFLRIVDEHLGAHPFTHLADMVNRDLLAMQEPGLDPTQAHDEPFTKRMFEGKFSLWNELWRKREPIDGRRQEDS